jgi:hypothetical protein
MKKLSKEDVVKRFEENEFYLLDDFEYSDFKQKVNFIDKYGYKYCLSISAFSSGIIAGSRPRRIHCNNPYVIHNIRQWITENNSSFELRSNEYVNAFKKLSFKCKNCNREFERTWVEISDLGVGCYYCSGQRKRPDEITKDSIKNIVSLYEQGKTIEFIREMYHVRETTISDILKNNNVTIKRTYNYYTSKEMAHGRKYYCNEDIFEKIDSHDKAYWLGFLYADGNVYAPKGKDGGNKGIRIELSLKEEDYYHLCNFSGFLQSNYPVKEKIVKLNGKEILVYRIAIGSVKMGNDLISHGCVPRKSLILEYPKDLDDKYFGSFLCGYFDGDGCLVYKSKTNGKFVNSVSLMGTYNFLETVKNKLEELDVKTRDINKCKGNVFILGISNYSHSNFYNLIYNKSSYMLGRKFDKFRDMLDERNKDFEISGIARLFRKIY